MELPACLDRVSQAYLSYKTARGWEGFKNSALYLMAPTISQGIQRSGETSFPPPLKNPKDVVLILCNHQSDMDQFIAFTSTNFHTDGKFPICFTGFTHEGFKTLPLVGDMVNKNLMGLEKGESKKSIQNKIQTFRSKGYNTFLLFPEGTFLHRDSLKSSQQYQASLGIDKKKHFKKLLYPRFGAYDSFVSLLKDDIRYVVDLTIDYPEYDAAQSEWSYLTYPSVAYSYLHKPLPPYLHARTIHITTQKLDHAFLLTLWRKKDIRLAVRHQRELQKKYPHLFLSEKVSKLPTTSH